MIPPTARHVVMISTKRTIVKVDFTIQMKYGTVVSSYDDVKHLEEII